MKTVVDSRLLEEAGRFAFRFACEDCVHFTDSEQCAHGYPPGPRQNALALLDGQDVITFCKEFELR